MKVLRGFLNVIISMILVILIFGLSMTFVAKKIVEDEIVKGIAKKEIITQYIESSDVDLTDEQKNTIKDILNDEDTDEIIDIVIDNYLSYSVNEDYNVSKKDYDLVIKYIEKHIDRINELYEDVDMDYIKENLTYENINSLAKEGFAKIGSDEDISIDTDSINAYAYVVSNEARYIILSGIGLMILLLMLINWSISKWMLEVGISLIISGVFVNLIYILLEFIKEALTSENELSSYITGIDLKSALLIGVFEIVFGIALIIIKNKISKTEIKESME